MADDRMTSSAVAMRPDSISDIIASHTSSRSLHDDDFVDGWISSARRKASLSTMIVPLDDIQGWRKDEHSGNIIHKDGKFFSVMGIHCRHRTERSEIEWDQPIIEQPETGILGILAKKIDGVLHFSLQAKEEPGNIGGVQLSPTVQATYSNYTGAHGGTAPLFLSHFISPASERIIFARMQSEDGGRFLYKSNRNMIIDGGDGLSVELPDGFIWLTLRQISRLIRQDDLVNACARSILSALLFLTQAGDVARDTGDDAIIGCQSLPGMLQWLDDRRAVNHVQSRRIGLNELQEWQFDGKGFFSHKEKRFFRVVGLKISSETREVTSWGQPIIENLATGIIGLLVRKVASGMELLMQAKAEVGNRNTVQLGPTVQFTQANYEGSRKLAKPFLYEEFLEPSRFRIIHESRQSEEGARFYREHHLHRVLLFSDDAGLVLPPDYRWVQLEQVMFMVHLGKQVNSCARSILSCLL